MAHTMELGAETAKLNKETFCYPVKKKFMKSLTNYSNENYNKSFHLTAYAAAEFKR
jgi:hypothetical protein